MLKSLHEPFARSLARLMGGERKFFALEVDEGAQGNIEGIGDFDIFGDARVVLAGLDAGDDGLVGVHHEGKPLLGKVLGNAMRPDLLTKRVNAGLHLFLLVVHGAKSTLMTNQS